MTFFFVKTPFKIWRSFTVLFDDKTIFLIFVRRMYRNVDGEQRQRRVCKAKKVSSRSQLVLQTIISYGTWRVLMQTSRRNQSVFFFLSVWVSSFSFVATKAPQSLTRLFLWHTDNKTERQRQIDLGDIFKVWLSFLLRNDNGNWRPD